MFETILTGVMSEQHVEGVVLVDSEGEALYAFSVAQKEDALRIVGAYQAIILGCMNRIGSTRQNTVVIRFQNGTVLSHHLKDGYFVCIIFSNDVNFAHAQFVLSKYYDSLIKELS